MPQAVVEGAVLVPTGFRVLTIIGLVEDCTGEKLIPTELRSRHPVNAVSGRRLKRVPIEVGRYGDASIKVQVQLVLWIVARNVCSIAFQS